MRVSTKGSGKAPSLKKIGNYAAAIGFEVFSVLDGPICLVCLSSRKIAQICDQSRLFVGKLHFT